MKSKKVVSYFVYGYCSCNDDDEFPDFQFETRSIDQVVEIIGTCNFERIDLEVVRNFDDGSVNEINVYEVKELYEVMHK